MKSPDLGKDFFKGDEEGNMLNICFDKVVRDEDLLSSQQRSGSNKAKIKYMKSNIVEIGTNKVIDEFVLRNLSMWLAKKNLMTGFQL